MQVVIGIINVIYLLSLLVTHIYYKPGPIYDQETDQIIGQQLGLTWKHILMLVPFTGISSYTYKEINKLNGIGVRPAMMIDVLGLNLFTQFLYSFTNYGIYLLWIAPLYAIWKFGSMVIGFCCPNLLGMGGGMGMG